jgi:anti-sigma factor ChrR (cupin superfamily)
MGVYMNPEDLSELASLYILNALDAEEQSWVEAQYENLSAFQAEASEAEAIASLLAYNVPALPMALDLKDRLFQRITAKDALENNEELAALLEQARTANWQPYQPVPGVQFATLRVDPNTRQVDCFVRSFAQIKFPQHRHAGNEEIRVLEGDLAIGDQVYMPGDRIYSQPGTVHQPETRTGCTLFLRTSLDDEILS